jgi:hypothetical protein
LETYGKTAGHILESTVRHISSFEISDLWDLDQTFFIKLETDVSQGYNLGLSFFSYLDSRGDGIDKWGGIFHAYIYSWSVPYIATYNYYGIQPKTVNDLPEDERLDEKAVLEAGIGFQRIQIIEADEQQCDPNDVRLDCNCKDASRKTCGPYTLREYYMKSYMDVMQDPTTSMADIEKLTQQIESRRYAVAAKRKILTEVKSRLQMRVNDVDEKKDALEGAAQNTACHNWSQILFDQNHTAYPSFNQSVCDEIGTRDANGNIVPTGIALIGDNNGVGQ